MNGSRSPEVSPGIVSASRRTDLPAFYAPWLFRRLEAGFAFAVNPFNPHQVSRIDLSPEAVTCLVLWTRNPGPLLARLPWLEARGYRFLVQATHLGYPRELEPRLLPPHRALGLLRTLGDRLGPDRTLWRYDPVLLSHATDPSWHRRRFSALCAALAGRVGGVTLSFLDRYPRTERRLRALRGTSLEPWCPERAEEARGPLARDLGEIAAGFGLEARSCAETGLEPWGILPGACIDGERIARLWGVPVPRGRDRNQRPGCRCAPSRDLGAYDTCPGGCAYCYALSSPERALGRFARGEAGKEGEERFAQEKGREGQKETR
ncbi:DUF1848 domain-containing protein [Aminomonas paucivorans]|uniref:DUF1848 domain-containing protein n=1 Tax=Aminomonas paucivorans TaxID=81412 RepID=UPI003329C7FD